MRDRRKWEEERREWETKGKVISFSEVQCLICSKMSVSTVLDMQ